MKSYQALAMLLTMAASRGALAVPTPTSTEPTTSLTASSPDDSSNTNANDDSSINLSKIESDKERLADTSEVTDTANNGKCIDITFTSSNPNLNYKFNGGWGLGSGNVGRLNTKSLCGSGAMFFGSQSPPNLGSAAGGNTKLECTVVGDGKNDNVCNISVVDGYSNSMHCTGFGAGDIGGTQNLFNLGNCPKKNNSGPGGPTCVNTGGHTNNAAQFFKNGGKYWYQDNVAVKTTFKGTPKIHCAIGP